MNVSTRSALPALFLASIFWGDVWLGITLPVSMLLLPAVLLTQLKPASVSAAPLGVALLTGMGLPLAVQFYLGRPINGKADFVVYLPVAYALATMLALQRTQVSDQVLSRALTAGGFITGFVMLGMMALVPANRFLVPGQDYYSTQLTYQRSMEEKARQRANAAGVRTSESPEAADGRPRHEVQDTAPAAVANPSHSLSRAELGLENSPSEAAYYEWKRSIRNALGHSNYISAFLVFLVCVSLFSGRMLNASVFTSLTLMTLSRFGIIMLFLAIVVWLLHRKWGKPLRLAIAIFACGVIVMMSLLLLSTQDFPLPVSVANRAAMWHRAFGVIAEHVLVGAPRSHILEEFSLNIIWHPHNVLLWVGSLVGLLGLGFYIGYLFVAMATIYGKISQSPLWTGVFFGLMILLSWSLLEPIAFTPSFDILLAALYVLALNHAEVATDSRVVYREPSLRLAE